MKEKTDLYIQKLSKNNNEPPTDSGRSHIFGQISFDQLNFATAQVAVRPQEYFGNEKNINAKTTIGIKSKHPIEIEGPAVVAAMSFGALSENAKLAIAKGSALSHTIDNTGEGGMLAKQRKMAKFLIVQYSTGRFGVDEAYLRAGDAVEIKYGQGAKPGQGGLLPGYKVSKKIAATRSSRFRKIKEGESIHSPAAHPDILSIKDLSQRIGWLRKLTGGKPIIVKIGACDLEADLPLIVKAKPDIIAIDGGEGGTGASPAVMLHNTGLPTVAALIEARSILNKIGAPQELWIGGGITKGADMAKALALGADMVFVGSALMKAMGCVGCGKCHEGKCPLGICTQEPELVKKLNIKEAAQKVANYFISTRKEVKMLAAACGLNNIYDFKNLARRKLIPLTAEMARITGLPFPGIERVTRYFN